MCERTMRSTLLLGAVVAAVLIAFSCKPPATLNDGGHDGGGDADADADTDQARPDADDDGSDTGGGCETPDDCDDGVECTEDLCGVGGVCRNIALDDRCPEGQVCVERVGCREFECAGNEDCDDGVFCNGMERCVGGDCFPGEPRDCDDGNECTADSCNVMTDSCAHEPLPGCVPTDGGVDGGPEPFDPEVHYSGSFRVFGIPASDCGAATFNITRITITSSSEELRMTAGAFPLTQRPRPLDAHFDVSYEQSGCGTYRLVGDFIDSNTFNASWTANFFGSCGLCGDQSSETTGVRE